MSKMLLQGVTGLTGFTDSLVSFWLTARNSHFGRTEGNLVKSWGRSWFWMFLWPTLTQPSKKFHLSTPFRHRSWGYTEKVDFSPACLGFAEAGLRSVGIPPKPRWCHTICVEVCWGFDMAKFLLRGLTGFTDSLFSFWTRNSKLPLRANRGESCEELG